ncbi:MAG: ferredoxin, partial [Alistipes sp.]|nr:ferredoxin [Alistipes sp.]
MKKLILAIMATAAMFGCASTPKSDATPAKVYMTTDISAEGLVRVYEALGVEATGKVAVKI